MDSCKVAVFFHRLKMQSVPEKPFLHDENKKPEAENRKPKTFLYLCRLNDLTVR
jgi:hypothetical protein